MTFTNNLILLNVVIIALTSQWPDDLMFAYLPILVPLNLVRNINTKKVAIII